MNRAQNFDLSVDGAQCHADRLKLESPIETLFIDAFEKYVSSKVEIYPQHEVQTPWGMFRLDFLLQLGEKRIAIECDGKDFHDAYRDEWRDALMLGSNLTDSIYRFRGKDLFWNVNDCVHLIYFYDKDLFNSRYQYNYSRLITEDLQERLDEDPFVDQETHWIDYAIRDENNRMTGMANLVIHRRCQADKKAFWNSLFSIAEQNHGASIEQLISLKERKP
ncbi:hypothetical protein [Dyadobacter pollutisoli]|uniref:DUF559 domain-containing protein n=1 Tax=Dyadobacter pollutisoli TaxID=2910158 RepID=A0A9E8NFM2_9BACT|nr:hypothetical protein [Dyadobacter pollutisoli]WAC13392.1 hypothetical protein ON006_05395 [Dyadobacter pollutisoli]